MVGLGGTITVADANVLLIASNVGFANAADLAAELLANPITFASAQTDAFNHYIVAYQDFDGDVRIADMNIHANGLTSFTTTAGAPTLAISDMVELEGVSLTSLQSENITFVSNDEIANSSYSTSPAIASPTPRRWSRPTGSTRPTSRSRPRPASTSPSSSTACGPDDAPVAELGHAAADAGPARGRRARCGTPTAPTRRSTTPSWPS